MVADRLPFASLRSLAFGWLGQLARVSSLRCQPALASPLRLRAGNATCIPQFLSSAAVYPAGFSRGMLAIANPSAAAVP